MANVISFDSSLVMKRNNYNSSIAGYESLDDNKKLTIRDSNGRLRYFRLTENRQFTSWCVRTDNKKYYINLQETKISIPFSYSYRYDDNYYVSFYTNSNSKITTSSQFNLNCTVSLYVYFEQSQRFEKIPTSPTISAYNNYSDNMKTTSAILYNDYAGEFFFEIKIDDISDRYHMINHTSIILPYTTSITNKTLEVMLYYYN